MGVEHRKGGLQAHDTHGAALEPAAFFLPGVGGVVCGDHVDGAVQQPFDQGVPVRGGAQGGIHLEAAVLLDVGVREGQVVGRGLAAHIQALGLGRADEGHALFRGDVADVVGAAGLPYQGEVPLHLAPLALGGDARVAMGGGVGPGVDISPMEQALVLAVGGDELAQTFGLQHGLTHPAVGLDALAVVGEGAHITRQRRHV